MCISVQVATLKWLGLKWLGLKWLGLKGFQSPQRNKAFLLAAGPHARQERAMMNGYAMGWGMGFGWLWMIVILVLVGLAIAALVKYLRK